ncbi:MAG TPA: prepilin-type N-terminal cleavage/methylation domain-containing protein [Gammaproteobacteria bacterium]|nr:prepilin-type N-terminal cleavage/methylation domain-containing protein [Gammaproteobacteria bacterium]
MKEKGFSLIELIIVIVIIGMLSVIAIPAYQRNSTKNKIGAVYDWATSYQNEIKMYVEQNNTWPNAAALGMSNPITVPGLSMLNLQILNQQGGTNCGSTGITNVVAIIRGGGVDVNQTFNASTSNYSVGTNWAQLQVGFYYQKKVWKVVCGISGSNNVAADTENFPKGCQQAWTAPTCI